MVPNKYIYIYVYTHHKWLRKSSEVPSLGKATLFFPNNIQCQHIKPWFSFLDLLILAVGWPQPIVDDLRYPVEYVNQVQHGKSQRWTAIHHQHSSCCTNVSGTCPCHIHMRYLSRHECHMPYMNNHETKTHVPCNYRFGLVPKKAAPMSQSSDSYGLSIYIYDYIYIYACPIQCKFH